MAQYFHMEKNVVVAAKNIRKTKTLGFVEPLHTGWLKRNPWFEADVIPDLRARLARALE